MNSLSLLLTYEYVSKKIPLTWHDLKFGIEQNFLSQDAAIAHALKQVSEDKHYSHTVFELASLFSGESIQPYFNQLVDSESIPTEQEVMEKWLYLALDWIYNNREYFSNPLDAVEIVYSDFNYPTSIAHFIKYMPIEGPVPLTEEKAVSNLYQHWLNYLAMQSVKFLK